MPSLDPDADTLPGLGPTPPGKGKKVGVVVLTALIVLGLRAVAHKWPWLGELLDAAGF